MSVDCIHLVCIWDTVIDSRVTGHESGWCEDPAARQHRTMSDLREKQESTSQ